MGSKSSPKKTRSQQISKKLQSLSSKIEEAGAQFEAQKGHRLSQADKMKDESLEHLKLKQVNLLLQQDTKSRKNCESLVGRTGERRNIQGTNTRFIVKKSAEEDRKKLIKMMAELRLAKNRPIEIDEMTMDQLIDEKNDMQTQLNEYERVHGLQIRQTNKETMNQVYERYWLLLRLTRRFTSARWSLSSLPRNGIFLDSIPEDDLIPLEAVDRRMSLEATVIKNQEDWEELPVVRLFVKTQIEKDFAEFKSNPDVIDENAKFHNMTRSELSSTLRSMREEKRSYRRQIKTIEQKFREENGRRMSKEEKETLEVYRIYRKIKPKMKLVDALLCKYSTVYLDH